MKNPLFCFLSVLLLTCTLSAADKESKYKIAGTWAGEIEVGDTKMPLIFEFEEAGNQSIKGILRSPHQTQTEIPLTHVSLKDRSLNVSIVAAGASYSGKLFPKTRKIRGEWIQGGFKLPLVLEFSEKGYELKRPQTPSGKPPYRVENVRFPNRAGNIVLDGTLTIPKDRMKKTPAVVLVSGSGPQDRDETLFGHKPFLVIADYLTRRGIAVLRYDDRGVGGSTGEFKYGTHMDFASDAAAAVSFLKGRKEIDSGKIGIIGHSEGGMIGPIVATKRPGDVAFIVMLAGPAVRGDLTILTQTKVMGKVSGLPESFIELNQEFSKALFDLLLANTSDPAVFTALAEKFEKEAENLKDIDPETLAGLGKSIQQQLEGFENPWLQNFIKYDPGPTLEKVKCPVLALNGEKDLQVLAGVHLPVIREKLKANGNPGNRVEELKGLNHLFQKANTGLPAEYARIEETISPSVLKLINGWIQSVTK